MRPRHSERTNRQTVFHSAGDRHTDLGLVPENLADSGVHAPAAP